MISTRGTYALRVLCDLAEHRDGSYTALKDIVNRQGISHKYLESIMSLLAKAGMVDSAQGKRGGYRLNRPPEEYRIGDILRLTEGSLTPVSCLDKDGVCCERSETCPTLPVWDRLNTLVNDYLDSVSLRDLVQN